MVKPAVTGGESETGNFEEFAIALLDGFASGDFEFPRSEGFDCHAGGGGGVGDAVFQCGEIVPVFGGQMSDQCAEVRIAGAGGVSKIGDRVGGKREKTVGVEKKRSVFAFFNQDHPRTHFEDFGTGANQVGFVAEDAGLAIVDQQHVEAREKLQEIRAGGFDPEIAGIGRNESAISELIENVSLKGRLDVSENNVRGGAIRIR